MVRLNPIGRYHVRLLVQDGSVIEPTSASEPWRIRLPNGQLMETTPEDLEAFGYETRTGARKTTLPEGPEKPDPSERE